MLATVYTDAGARRNPGPAAIAYRIVSEDGELLASHAEYIGETTCNRAEYLALLDGLRAARRLAIRSLTIASDSELMVRQLRGEYRVRSPDLRTLHTDALESLERDFADVEIEHHRRSDSQIATCDRLVNETRTAAGFPKQPRPPHVRRWRRHQ